MQEGFFMTKSYFCNIPCRDLGNSNLSGFLVPDLGKLEHLQYLWVLLIFLYCLLLLLNACFHYVEMILWRFILWSLILINDLCNLHLLLYVMAIGNYYLCRELYKNKIQGTIPNELGNLKSLISLDLYNNNISGAIPPSLGKLKNLVFL